MRHQLISRVLALWAVSSPRAQARDPVQTARQHVAGHQAEMVLELRDFLTISNVASDLENIRLANLFRAVKILAAAASANVRMVP